MESRVEKAGRSAGAKQSPAGPGLGVVRGALDRAVDWLGKTRAHPTDQGLPTFRSYVLEVRTWYVLHEFEADPTRRSAYDSEIRTRLDLLGDGGNLLALLRNAEIKNYIGDLLVLMNTARGVGHPLPALERALPELIRRGLNEAPNRPIGLQIPFAWLVENLGLEIGPSVAELRPQGMLNTHPQEIGMNELAVYILTHEIFGISDYGLKSMDLSTSERDYVDRAVPFWTLFFAVMQNADLCAELVICQQVAGTAGTYEYGQGVGLVIAAQAPEGYFRLPKTSPSQQEVIHAVFVGIQALLGHEALLTGRGLPGD